MGCSKPGDVKDWNGLLVFLELSGGAVVMNAGAHNSCIADILVSAQVLSADGTLETLNREQLGYSYRTSLLQKKRSHCHPSDFPTPAWCRSGTGPWQ